MSIKNYIVTLKEQISEADTSSVKSHVGKLGGTIKDEFSLIKGFSCSLPETAAKEVQDHQHVFNIEEDKEVKIN